MITTIVLRISSKKKIIYFGKKKFYFGNTYFLNSKKNAKIKIF